jgi:hypothetical protein
MTSDPSSALVEALEHFLKEAKEAVDQELHRDTPLPLTPHTLAESLAELPSAEEARVAAHRAATANMYLVASIVQGS